jgi:dTDP-4-dehydrorhamnose reductase
MVPPKVLITGAAGQLGRDVSAVLARSYETISLTRETGDITNKQQIIDEVSFHQPIAVINCAAFTDVDGAESNQEMAFRINAEGAENIALACKQTGARMIHISTDYVFDGSSQRPYVENDATNPLNQYGKSKLAGEERVAAVLPNHLILRTAWVYGQFGKNFVKTMLKLGQDWRSRSESGEKPQPIKVVNDQTGNPTWTLDLSEQIHALIAADITGIVHATSEGETTWYDLARMIFGEVGLAVDVISCSSEQFPRPAERPANSSLENRRLKEYHLNRMPNFQDSLIRFLQNYKETLSYA